jgi:type I restriction enzyme S subunit
VKAGWATKTLGDACEVIAGQSPAGAAYNSHGKGLPFYQGKKEFEDKYVGPPTTWTTEITKRAKANDILMSVRAPVGPINFATQEICIGRGLASIRAKAGLDQNFLFYFLLSIQSQISGRDGAVFPSISRNEICAIKLSIPQLSEQQRIVAILDEAFAGLATATANAEKNLKNARELFESYLKSIFTRRNEQWSEKSLREVSIEFGRGKSKHRPRNDPALYGGKYPFIQTGDIRNSGGVILERFQTYNERGLAQSKLWPKGTICITIAANIAETGILGFDACFPDSVIGMVVDPTQTNNKFVEYLLRFFKAILQAQGKGSAQDNINLATFENRKFPFPPVNVQNDLATRLDAMAEEVRRLQSSYETRLQFISDLRQSILDRAFSGDLASPPPQAIKEAAE